MAGQIDRSGGHNRRSAAEHRQSGTFRADRHGAAAAGTAAAGRLAGLLARYAFHERQHDQLRRTIEADGRGGATLPVLRECRQHALLLSSLGAAIARAEQVAGALPPASDEWSEFEVPEFAPFGTKA